MFKKLVIREDINKYMSELKEWLEETDNTKLESMVDFFKARIDDYENHMAQWESAYKYMAKIIPDNTERILDIGCGTGLEIDSILAMNPKIEIIGIDLSKHMLEKLQQKHTRVKTICIDYFKFDYNSENFDVVISFETLHHFKPHKKQALFEKIYKALPDGGTYIEADYIACCDEEEGLLMRLCDKKRKEENIPDNEFVHFDTPLTAEHEMKLLSNAGFKNVEILNCINGVCFITAKKQ
ncbi:MAG: Carboxy-S-adenosyl-L-methionine synthase [Eubacteriales bacterium SKADARSKE-1]|nr:Carboxy-S-adenosyl-L-methionine synthase [Eubacteriales bacterium SKADARSKE-1]